MDSNAFLPRGKDHPRGCGEHTYTGVHLGLDAGIIPADAGSTADSIERPVHAQDHPRGCGEHINDTHQPLCELGSSPRMRGAHMSDSFSSFGKGIIPADAGSTGSCGRHRRSSRDHPRGCGEHCRLVVLVLYWSGSSPRMRGAHWWVLSRAVWLRIIPADAGSTESLMCMQKFT